MSMIQQLVQEQKAKSQSEDDLIDAHHDLMVVYGWIPLEEFKALPLPTLWNLHGLAIKETAKREEFRIVVEKALGYKHAK